MYAIETSLCSYRFLNANEDMPYKEGSVSHRLVRHGDLQNFSFQFLKLVAKVIHFL